LITLYSGFQIIEIQLLPIRTKSEEKEYLYVYKQTHNYRNEMWINEPTICLVAARRTVEGGRNLREKHWAEPYSYMVK